MSDLREMKMGIYFTSPILDSVRLSPDHVIEPILETTYEACVSGYIVSTSFGWTEASSAHCTLVFRESRLFPRTVHPRLVRPVQQGRLGDGTLDSPDVRHVLLRWRRKTRGTHRCFEGERDEDRPDGQVLIN